MELFSRIIQVIAIMLALAVIFFAGVAIVTCGFVALELYGVIIILLSMLAAMRAIADAVRASATQ